MRITRQQAEDALLALRAIATMPQINVADIFGNQKSMDVHKAIAKVSQIVNG